MSEPITTYNGRVVLFNNGVVDVVQGETSLVDENKVAHIPEGGNVEIDNLTIIKNADDELEVPFDNNTIYRDQDGFIKARSSGGSTYTAGDGIQISNDEISVKKDEFISKKLVYPGITGFRVDWDTPPTETGVTYETTFTNAELHAYLYQGYWNYPVNTVTRKGYYTLQTDGGYDYTGNPGNGKLEYVYDEEWGESGLGFQAEYTKFLVYIDGDNCVMKYRNDSPSLDVPLDRLYVWFVSSPVTEWAAGWDAPGGILVNDGRKLSSLSHEWPLITRTDEWGTNHFKFDYDKNTFAAGTTQETYDKFIIKDGVLPKYTNNSSTRYIIPEEDMRYYSTNSHLIKAANAFSLEEGATYTAEFNLGYVSSIEPISGDLVCELDPNTPEGGPQWYNLRGTLTDADGRTVMTGICASYQNNDPFTQSQYFIYIDPNYDDIAAIENAENIYGCLKQSVNEQYVNLGSQLGTGWEQDREYTVKFKNGKLYLS